MTPEEHRSDYIAMAPLVEYLRDDMKALIVSVRELTREVSQLRDDIRSTQNRVEKLEANHRPCPDLTAHLESHRCELARREQDLMRRSDRWWTVWVRVSAGVITWILAAALGAFAALWGAGQ